MNIRPRRLRENKRLRRLVRENHLTTEELILPLFIKETNKHKTPITSMPGHYQHSLESLIEEIQEIQQLKLPGVMLFGIPEHKDAQGSAALFADSIVAQAIRSIKKVAPDLLVIADLCLCEYTSHGHCGVLQTKNDGSYHIDNDSTLDFLAKQAEQLAKAGADIIAPSGMMDGMVAAIRQQLDICGFEQVPILSYAVKYASAFYAPFREAADGAPQVGDRNTYQMDSANSHEALREAALDSQQGADMLMVKPAQSYLDIVYRVKQAFPHLPLAAYQVSGEFAMIKAAAQHGWLDEQQAMLESLISIKRAGADFIISYFAKDFASARQ